METQENIGAHIETTLKGLVNSINDTCPDRSDEDKITEEEKINEIIKLATSDDLSIVPAELILFGGYLRNITNNYLQTHPELAPHIGELENEIYAQIEELAKSVDSKINHPVVDSSPENL